MVTAILYVAAPAQAFAHGGVHNPYLHALLDVLTLTVVAAPIVTAYLWGSSRRGLLVALMTLVQIPVAVIGFVPMADPILHLTFMPGALAITAAAVWAVRRSTRQEAGHVQAAESAG
jgi:hypothetical protein